MDVPAQEPAGPKPDKNSTEAQLRAMLKEKDKEISILLAMTKQKKEGLVSIAIQTGMDNRPEAQQWAQQAQAQRESQLPSQAQKV